MDHISIKSAFVGLEKYFIRGFFVYFTLLNKHSVGYRVFTILTISLVFTFLLTMGVVSQVMAAAPTAAPSSLSQCKAPEADKIFLCWTASTVGANDAANNIKSYYITNATETCSGDGADRTCSFGSFAASFNAGLNQTGGALGAGLSDLVKHRHGAGTGSDATVANFTGLSAGQVFKFIIYGENNQGTSAASSTFIATTALASGGNYQNKDQVFGNGTNFGDSTQFAADQDFTLFQNFGAGIKHSTEHRTLVLLP